MNAPVRMRSPSWLAAALAGALAAGAAWAGIPATTASDICASNANPCNVTQSYDITPNAVLDFGTRTVNVTGSGQFNFGTGSGRIACGSLNATTTSAFINAVGIYPTGGSGSGSVLLTARRACSSGANVPCLDSTECQLGPCGVRRCSLRSTRTCTADADCQIGTCNTLKRCSGLTSVRCTTNADCDYGTCPGQLTCTGRGDNPVACSTNTDCAFGTCSTGIGSLTLDGPIAGTSESPATILLRAADDVTILKPINLNGTTLESDGGSLSIDARGGTITVNNNINLEGGGFSSGGSIEMSAAEDIGIYDDLSVLGGDFDGGSVDLTASRDITIRASILANSTAGAGFGGEILIQAERDLSFLGVSASNKSTIEMNGHTAFDNSAGDGGSLELTAGRNLLLDPNTRVLGNGSAPDGGGSDITFESTNATMQGDVVAKSDGISGGGGFVDVYVNGTATVGAAGTFDVTGGTGGGGFFQIDSSGGDIDFGGETDVSGGGSGGGGTAFLSAKQAADMTGTLFSNGSSGALLGIEACRLTLASGGEIDNVGTAGRNLLITHDTMRLLSGSSVTADPDGTNSLRYRNPGTPPVIQGTVSPSPSLAVDSTLSQCPLCGNGNLDSNESCDDGNAVGGDGCSAACQNERCLSQTISPGYPTVALCEDGNVCTDDVCNTTLNGGTCQHPAKNCSDGISCTADSCNPNDGSCLHNPSDALCNDSNACTDDFCSLAMGCSNTANSSPCDDNNRCTHTDVCANKVCRGTRISGCLFCGDDYLNPIGGEECDDGNTENGDCCNSTCLYEPADNPCEDGLFCTVGDTCNATGTCMTGEPNTCADADACTADSCDEELIQCVHSETPRQADSCLAAPRARLQIKNTLNPKRDKLQWQWKNGAGFLPEDLGSPESTTAYTLCVYDESVAGSSLKASIDIGPSSTRWKRKAAFDILYKDKFGSSEGVTKARLKAGEAGETQVKVGAGGTNLLLPAPAGAAYFQQNPSVVVQLLNDAGRCWTSQFTQADTRDNDEDLFKAASEPAE